MPATRVILTSDTNRPAMGYDRVSADELFAIEAGIREGDEFFVTVSDNS